MDRVFFSVAAFILFLEAGYTKIRHEHVHYELPKLEVIVSTTVRTSGDTSTVVSYY